MKLKIMLENPCRDCPDRVPPTKETNGCRSTCEKWKKYSEEYAEKHAKKKQSYELWNCVTSYEYQRYMKEARKKHNERRGRSRR